MSEQKQEVVVLTSGGFDPLHIGHVRLINESKKLGTKLIVLLNNDNWLKLKKGYVFMPQKERKEILEALESVDEVVYTFHEPNTEDISVCKELEAIKPDIFTKGGDRTADNIPEVAVCERIGCEIVYNIGQGGKVQSSSWLLKKFKDKTGRTSLR